MSTLQTLHARLADSLVLFLAVVGLWSLVAALRRRGVGSETWGMLVIGELLALVQGGLGLTLYLSGERPGRGVHLLYGVVALLSLPAYYAISRGRDDRRASWAYGLVCLFLAGISARAMTTGA
jgi:hypothetical protein